MTTLVFGHKSPDTDSTGSPLIWAWYLNDVRGEPAEARLLGDPNTEAKFVAQRWGFELPTIMDDIADGTPCVIVDTNNPEELPANLGNAAIRSIIDHHKLTGGISTKAPIDITVRPLACTATIMYQMMGSNAARMPEGIKGLMLSCILSDTLEFRSPTTTAVDKDLAEALAADLGVTIPDYAAEMFSAKSDVSAFSEAELIRMDSKVNEVDGVKMRVSVLETTAPHMILNRKDALLAAMPGIAQEDGIDEILLFVVDILKEEATLLIPTERVRHIAQVSFSTHIEGDHVVLPGIMSRKLQIIPALKV